jgi:hypothetical protein
MHMHKQIGIIISIMIALIGGGCVGLAILSWFGGAITTSFTQPNLPSTPTIIFSSEEQTRLKELYDLISSTKTKIDIYDNQLNVYKSMKTQLDGDTFSRLLAVQKDLADIKYNYNLLADEYNRRMEVTQWKFADQAPDNLPVAVPMYMTQ